MNLEFRFNDDERKIINGILEKESLSEFSKESMLKKLDFLIALIPDDMNEEWNELYFGLRNTIENLSVNEWETLKDISPLYSPEEPTEEELEELLR